MKYYLKTDNFCMEWSIEHLDKEPLSPVNAIMMVKAESYGFCGMGEMDIDMKAFLGLLNQLENLYDTLFGEAIIQEPYGNKQFIRFEGDGKGHIMISGLLAVSINDCSHSLHFENQIDQTELGRFIAQF